MQEKSDNYFLAIIGIIPVVWLALLLAPYLDDGIISLVNNYEKAISNPFSIQLSKNTISTTLIFLIVYFLALTYYFTSRRNYRYQKEHGSAKFGRSISLNKKYEQHPKENNKILTSHVRLGLDGKIHRRNLNTLVIGGSGAGKTRFYCKPNIMQCNTSYVILDPKGEIVRDLGYMLEKKGYEIKVLDLINMERSHCYNPFVYIRNDNDIQRLVTNIFKSTTPKGSQSSDPFWDQAASMLLLALMYYLYHLAPEEEQNFSMVLEMLRAGDVKEDDENYSSPLDILFSQLEWQEPNHIAVKYYKGYRSGGGKTLKSIQITLASKLEKFNLDSMASLTLTDELELASLGEKKVALFAIIPDNDTSFNFLISILYTQLFQQLFSLADDKYNGSLPVPVHFVMDEFANVSLPDDFEKILSVCRSRKVFVSIILQNLSQVKALFEKQWEGIVGNCDELLYLGGMEQSTHKFLSEFMGKETIDTKTFGKTTGRNGHYSTNYQMTGRELMTADEIRGLNNKYALLFIRGEKPVKDLKYDILKHPNLKLTADGSAKPYIHGSTENSSITLSLIDDVEVYENINIDQELENYELISSEEIENYIKRLEENKK